MMEINIHPALQHKLPDAAKAKGMTVEAFLQNAIATAVEDWEDLRDANEALNHKEPLISLEELERGLGVIRS